MKRMTLAVCLATVGIALTAAGNPIADNPLFKKVEGKWEGEGSLTGSDGSKSPLKETWTGKFTETGNFVVSGKRLLDQLEHDFAWEYYPNGDLIEGQMKVSEPELDIRFEVTISEADRSITMKIPSGNQGDTMIITNTVSEDGKKISGTIKTVNPAGDEISGGEMTHEKKDS
jgi:hypothetical protein